MNKIFLILLFLCLIFASGLSATETETREVKVSVSGMSCMSCVKVIKQQFSSHEAVEKAEVSLSEKLLRVKLKSDKELPDEEIEAMLTEGGYKAVKIDRS
jgi:copper chaperone CopZ